MRTSKYNNIFGKGYNPNWSDETFVIKKLKAKSLEHFKKKNIESLNWKSDKENWQWIICEVERLIFFHSWKETNIVINYYPKPEIYDWGKIKVKLDLSKYAIKSDLKGKTGINTSTFPEKAE